MHGPMNVKFVKFGFQQVIFLPVGRFEGFKTANRQNIPSDRYPETSHLIFAVHSSTCT